MNAVRILLGGLIFFAAAEASAADPHHGEALFAYRCAPCHAAGPGHPGTMGLERRYDAHDAVLAQRGDVPTAYVEAVVRHGLRLMPPFRPSELDDRDLADIAAYLARPKSAIH